MSNKVLSIIFIILFLVAGGELIYFYFLSGKKINLLSKGNNHNVTADKTIPISQRICFVPQSDKSILNTGQVEAYKRMPPNNLDKVDLQIVYSGTIVDLKGKGRIKVNKEKYLLAKRDFYEYQAIIVYKKPNETKVSEYIVPSETMATTKIFEQINGDLIPMNLNDFKINDSIKIEERIDLLDRNCVSYLCVKELKIIKLSSKNL